MRELIAKLFIFYRYSSRPWTDSFEVWLSVMLGMEKPSMLYDDMNFFNLYNEDFFEWYAKQPMYDTINGNHREYND